jgi:hypothetical protein
LSRALLNDPKVISYVNSNFVPVSGAVEMLQPSRYGGRESAASKWFERPAKDFIFKEQRKFWDEHHTLQGFYVMSADGKISMFKVGLPYNTDQFLGFLEEAKMTWERAPKQHVTVTPQEIADGGPESADPRTSVIRIFERVLPLDSTATLAERSIGRDHMWIFPQEVQQIVAKASTPNAEVPMPPSVVSRMVRFHLLNNVGNLMNAYYDHEVKLADFKVRLLKAEANTRHYAFTGIYNSASDEKAERGASFVNGTIYGTFDVDAGAQKITRWRAYGEATTQGRNDSLDKTRPYPLVFAMTEATDKVAQATPPFWYAVSPIFHDPYKTAVLPDK